MVQDNEGSPMLNISHYSLLEVVMLLLKNPSAMLETLVGSLGWEDSPGKGNSYPLQDSCLENSMSRRVWWSTVRGVTKS